MSGFDYELIKNIDNIRNVPVLTLDQRWYQLMPDANKTEEVRFWEARVNELLKRQGQISHDYADLKVVKATLIQNVVDSMEELSDARHKKKMDVNQKLMQETKEKMLELEDERLELPRKLAEANQRLLAETLKVCYGRINENNEDLLVIDKWINATRVKLKKNLLIKQDKENTNNMLYSGLHDILGAEIMSQLDKINDGEK